MRRLIVGIVGVGGIVLSLGVAANESFDDHDTIQEGAGIQSVIVPGQEQSANSEIDEQYKKALREARQRGDPRMADQLVDKKDEPELLVSPKAVISGAEELPFQLLQVSLDRDQDGLSDGDEIRLVTDPNNPDTDNDGYIDGLEVIRGYNPLVAGPGDKIEYKEPVGQTNAQYKITGIRLTESAGEQMLTVTGMGPNDALVAVLLFSKENRTWVARTDRTGRFLFVSADALDPGEYKAYASAVSANGLPLAFSKQLMFERTESSLIKEEESSREVVILNEEEETKLDRVGIVVGAGGLVAAMGAAVLIWTLKRRKKLREVQL